MQWRERETNRQSIKPFGEEGNHMNGGRNYTFKLRTGKDGTQYFLIQEAPPSAHRHSVPHWASSLAERLALLKVGFQRAFRSVCRRA